MKRATLVFGILLLSADHAGSQETPDLIRREIDAALETSLWRLGPFRLTPRLRLGAGYDSNGFSSPDFPREDITALAGPGVQAAVPFGNRALLELYEEVDFVYYRELEDLRDVYDVTRIRAALGGRRVVFRLEDEFRDEKARPSTELDVPVDQRTNRLTASVGIALGWRHEIEASAGRSSTRMLEPEVAGIEVKRLLDREESDFRLRLLRHLTPKTTLAFEGLYRVVDIGENDLGRDAREYGALAGFRFTPRTNVEGQALAGYKRARPDRETQAEYLGLIAAVDVRMKLGERLGVHVLAARDVRPSVQEGNWFFVENRYGGSLDVFLAPKLSVTPGVVLGRNAYPRAERFADAEGTPRERSVADRMETYSLGLHYHLAPGWALGATASYFRRDSNFPTFIKDRLLVNLGLNARF